MEETTFLDMAVLQRIDAESTVERFGTKINSSFFDAANILGGLKLKGLVSIESKFPGPSSVALTPAGSELLKQADERSAADIDTLDLAILSKVAEGAAEEAAIAGALNIRSQDLAFHIYKLAKKALLGYQLRGGKTFFSLTEEGFKQVGYRPKKEAAPAQQQQPAQMLPADEPIASALPYLSFWARKRAKLAYYAHQRTTWLLIALVIALAVLAYLLLKRV
jgi:predicted transcriptional regulator